jgi:hypothetical protein
MGRVIPGRLGFILKLIANGDLHEVGRLNLYSLYVALQTPSSKFQFPMSSESKLYERTSYPFGCSLS